MSVSIIRSLFTRHRQIFDLSADVRSFISVLPIPEEKKRRLQAYGSWLDRLFQQDKRFGIGTTGNLCMLPTLRRWDDLAKGWARRRGKDIPSDDEIARFILPMRNFHPTEREFQLLKIPPLETGMTLCMVPTDTVVNTFREYDQVYRYTGLEAETYHTGGTLVTVRVMTGPDLWLAILDGCQKDNGV